VRLGYTEITLKNAGDVVFAESGMLDHQEVRQATVTAMVDTGAVTLIINEKLCEELGLEIGGECQAVLPNCEEETVKMADPVRLHWKDRNIICRPLVASGDRDILLGAIPLEDMDIKVVPARRELAFANKK
jgi:hypothetical protein